MQEINISELKTHPRNNEFFDDITGDAWDQFLDSVKTSGIIEPIVTTQDMVIVSGHQRLRAAKELGMEKVMVDIHRYDDDDQVLKDLIETNIRQRGVGNPNPVKFGKCIKELERIYGIRDGSSNGEGTKIGESREPKLSVHVKTQKDLANELGLSVDTIQNYKKLTELIPELEDLVDTGIVAPSTARAIVDQMSQEEQEEFIASMDVTKKITNSQVQKYVDKINDLKANPPKPDDYESTKRRLKQSELENERLNASFKEKVSELQKTRAQLEQLENSEPEYQYNKKLKDSVLLFCSKVNTFIEEVGGYIWLTDEINKIPDLEREGYIRSVEAIKSWAEMMEQNIFDKQKEIS